MRQQVKFFTLIVKINYKQCFPGPLKLLRSESHIYLHSIHSSLRRLMEVIKKEVQYRKPESTEAAAALWWSLKKFQLQRETTARFLVIVMTPLISTLSSQSIRKCLNCNWPSMPCLSAVISANDRGLNLPPETKASPTEVWGEASCNVSPFECVLAQEEIDI